MSAFLGLNQLSFISLFGPFFEVIAELLIFKEKCDFFYSEEVFVFSIIFQLDFFKESDNWMTFLIGSHCFKKNCFKNIALEGFTTKKVRTFLCFDLAVNEKYLKFFEEHYVQLFFK
jgi:hypothetical protein